jgi:tRNA threonylcarbamoyladenosine biosynthesis protein TsaB
VKLLAIDTSTEICSVCLTEDDRVSAEYVSRSPITHTERLLPAVELLMNHVGWKSEDLDGLAVVNGPGSFTGLRISISLVKGLSFALGIPVVAANALEVAARQVPCSGLICPAMDARRGEIFTCLFERSGGSLTRRTEPRSVRPDAWRAELPEVPVHFCGPGADLYWGLLKQHEDSDLLFTDFVLARGLAALAERMFLRGEVLSGSEVRAAYLRPSDAEVKGPRPAAGRKFQEAGKRSGSH